MKIQFLDLLVKTTALNNLFPVSHQEEYTSAHPQQALAMTKNAEWDSQKELCAHLSPAK